MTHIEKIIEFNTNISSQKPRTINNQHNYCPFCDPEQLKAAIRKEEDICILPNKYPILKATEPYVLVETGACNSSYLDYSLEHFIKVISMGLDFWEELMKDPRFRSAIFFKNHGPRSGASLLHPHMQLMGLYEHDAYQEIELSMFEGIEIKRTENVVLTLSKYPLKGFTEFNIELLNRNDLKDFCDFLRRATSYSLNEYKQGRFDSFNLFFYNLEGRIFCKLIPRGLGTTLYIGYKLPHVYDTIGDIAEEVKRIYFTEETL